MVGKHQPESRSVDEFPLFFFELFPLLGGLLEVD
jgi:hypothetical protein